MPNVRERLAEALKAISDREAGLECLSLDELAEMLADELEADEEMEEAA